MEQGKTLRSRITQSTILDPKSELDERLEKSHAIISSIISGLSERETNEALQAYVCKGPVQHEEVQLGLLFTILTDPKSAPKCYREMTLVSRDGCNIALSRSNQLIHEKWIKLQDTPRTQLLWFSKELVKNNVTAADSVCLSLLRQIAGGDITPKNIWLTESLLDLLTENRSWLDKHPILLATTVYTYLRVIVDHCGTGFTNLQQREVDFCVSLLRDKWTDCMAIGRDLVRLLQYVARKPDIEKLWRDILFNPTVLSPTFTGIQQLMQMRTSRRYLINRLTPDMENKLCFITSKVRFGQQKRYQDWFQRQYLSTPESQSLRCDLIRYICAVIHPSNEVLCSDIIPRWAVIGWLLTTCTSNVAASHAKLSLFYDWLFYDPEKDSIMNIEPCILVMHHSMRQHPAITATLLDFMCRIMPNFCPALSAQVRQGMFTSLKTILEKRVLPSLSPLLDNPKLDKELRSMIRDSFTEFCSPDVMVEEPANSKEVMDMEPNNHMVAAENNNLSGGGGGEIAEFSDEEDDIPLGLISTGKLRDDLRFQPIKEPPNRPEVDLSEYIEQLETNIKQCVIDLQNERDSLSLQCEMMDRLIQTVIQQQEDFDQDMAAVLALCLLQLLGNQFTNSLFPAEIDEETIEDSIGTPLFVIFRNLCQTPEEDPSRQPILLLLEEMYLKQQRIGYHFLYFLKASKVHEDKMSSYKDFCNSMENQDLEACLRTDLTLCGEDDVRLLTYLIPDIYTQFPNIAIGNTDLLHLIVSCIDGAQLQELICQILQGHLIMFRKDTFLSVLNASLDWETIEQYFLWQLIAAHNIPVEHIMPILPKLDFTAHAEALSSILIQLKQDCPTADLLRPVMFRECKKTDLFSVSILKFWAQEYEDKLADLLLAQLTKSTGTPNRKRSRQQHQTNKTKEKEAPSVEQVMSHLEHMRQTCRNISFITHESIQQALQHVQTTCSDSLKARFGDLLALAEDIEDQKSTRVLRMVPSRRASSAAAAGANLNTSPKSNPNNTKNKKSIIVDDSDSETDSSEDEEIVRPRAKKRKKVTATVEDDSD